jgi:hypothetical protein
MSAPHADSGSVFVHFWSSGRDAGDWSLPGALKPEAGGLRGQLPQLCRSVITELGLSRLSHNHKGPPMVIFGARTGARPEQPQTARLRGTSGRWERTDVPHRQRLWPKSSLGGGLRPIQRQADRGSLGPLQGVQHLELLRGVAAATDLGGTPPPRRAVDRVQRLSQTSIRCRWCCGQAASP